jgi:L-aminopeptidase/D-esterase
MLDKFKIGHYTDSENGTGVTVVLAEEGAVGGVSVRGAAPATRETDLLSDGKLVQKLNAVVLSGGSAFGLEAADGVMKYLYEKGAGFDAGKYRVPIVSGASIYDLEYKNFAYPGKEEGYRAAAAAVSNNFASGSIGGGTGATFSKVLGIQYAVKGGLGVQTFSLNGLEIAVLTVCNALGDVIKDGKILAGALDPDGNFIDCLKVFTAGGLDLKSGNTTISCIMTNATLTKERANVLASLAHDGFARALSPSHTAFDGDAVFVMSSGEKNIEFNILTALIPDLVAKSIQNASDGQTKEKTVRISKLKFGIFQKMFKK